MSKDKKPNEHDDSFPQPDNLVIYYADNALFGRVCCCDVLREIEDSGNETDCRPLISSASG